MQCHGFNLFIDTIELLEQPKAAAHAAVAVRG